jgi:hypothetical protein
LYFVTSYRRPDQVLRLVETISRESAEAQILIHHDQFKTRLDAADVERAAPTAHLLSSPRPLKWGDFSVVDMHWRCFEWALDRLDFDWLILLSEQDYPVWPLQATEQLLRESGCDAFVGAPPLGPPDGDLDGLAEVQVVDATPEGPDPLRYHRYFYSYGAFPGAAILHSLSVPWAAAWRSRRQRAVDRVNRRPGRLVRAETYPDGMPTRFGMRRRSTPFCSSFPCWVGEAWFAVSRPAVSEIVSFAKTHPSYRRYYRWTIVPEESATVTILANSAALRIMARNLHFERWSDPYSGHPDVFRHSDLEEIIDSGMPFARKFDLATDTGVLDALDAARRSA